MVPILINVFFSFISRYFMYYVKKVKNKSFIFKFNFNFRKKKKK